MELINVLVLSGGPSSEREISIQTGRMVCEHLDSERYQVVPVEISRNGLWFLAGETENEEAECGNVSPTLLPVGKRLTSEVGRSIDRVLLGEEIDVVFIAMHGTYGEDGTIQGLLDAFGVRYTGSGLCASALAMDKVGSRHMFMQHRLPVPRWTTFDRRIWEQKSNQYIRTIEEKIKYPCVVKPNNQGSSIGVYLVNDRQELNEAIQNCFSLSRKVIVEELLVGTEITCGVLEYPRDKNLPKPLPIVEVVPKSSFFDFSSKYDPDMVEEIVPARIDRAVAEEASKIALKAHSALGCKGVSRTDMIVVGDTPYVLELNTIPGLTPCSLLPKAAKEAGIDFSMVLDMLIENALSD